MAADPDLDALAAAIAAKLDHLSTIPAEIEEQGPRNPAWLVPAAELQGLYWSFSANLAGRLANEAEELAIARGFAPAAEASPLFALAGSAYPYGHKGGRTAAEAAQLLAQAAWIAIGSAEDQERALLIGADTRHDEPFGAGDPRLFLADWAGAVMPRVA